MSTSFSVVLEYAALGLIVGRVRGADDDALEITSVPVLLPQGAALRVAVVERGAVVARLGALAYPRAHGLRLEVAARDLPCWRAVRRAAGRPAHCAALPGAVPVRRAFPVARALLRA